jgi:hypothetical protein
MLRALAPQILIAMLIFAAGGVAYGSGAPLWTFYVTLVVGLVSVLPGYERWEKSRGQQ